MKYKIGDKVRIKSIDWYHENKTVHGDVWFDNAVFVGGQSLYCGCELTIRLVTDDHYYVIENDYYWIDEMIEELVEEETKPKFKVGDKITNGNVTLTILTLSSDRYVVEDNFGECGTLYFNSQDGWKIVEEESEKKLSDESWRYKNIFDPSQYPQSFECPEGYIFKDENGNVINAQKIVLEKKPNDKLKLESTKKVREYWNEYTRIFIEIYDDEPNECILTHLLTLEGHRQKGYGKQALIQAEEIAKELGCHKAHLKVETNSWMHNWYLRCGYRWYKNANEGYTWLTKNL